MNDKSKKIFLALSIIVPFLLYSVYYYSRMIKNAPYKFSEFVSIDLKSGKGSDYERTFNSKSQAYKYIDKSDSVVNTKVKLNDDDLLYLHRKAAELGFWDWPEKMLGDTTQNAPRYYLAFNYQRKSKIIEINATYNDNEKLKNAALQLIKMVNEAIADAESRK